MRKAPNFSETFRYLYNNQIIKTMTNLQEIWKDIPGYEGIFQASNLGRIKSLSRLSKNRWGRYLTTERILRPTPDKKGYLKTRLFASADNFKPFRIHRLIALTFLPNPNNLPQVNHINGIKSDNRIENLEWIDNLSNMRHAYVNGIRNNGVRDTHNSSKKVIRLSDGLVFGCAKLVWEIEGKNGSYEMFCKRVRERRGYIYS